MTYQRLVEDINAVAQELDDTRITLISSPKELQKTISIFGSIIDKKLLIEILVPVVERNLYDVKRHYLCVRKTA